MNEPSVAYHAEVMERVREYTEGLPVKWAVGIKGAGDSVCIQAFNDSGESFTAVDLVQVMCWIHDQHPELIWTTAPKGSPAERFAVASPAEFDGGIADGTRVVVQLKGGTVPKLFDFDAPSGRRMQYAFDRFNDDGVAIYKPTGQES